MSWNMSEMKRGAIGEQHLLASPPSWLLRERRRETSLAGTVASGGLFVIGTVPFPHSHRIGEDFVQGADV